MLKQVILLLFIFGLCLFSLRAQTESEYNRENEQGQKTGAWRASYPNGKIRYTGQFVDGVPSGEFKFFFETGEMKSLVTYVSANEARVSHFYQSGEIMSKGSYKDKKRNGKWINYGGNGEKVSEGNYLLGEKIQEWKVYYPNGVVSETVNYERGIESGPYKTFYEDGSLLLEGVYVNGALEGEAKVFHPNGKIKKEGSYFKGTKNGLWKTFDEEGQQLKAVEYAKGRRITPLSEDELPADLEKFRDKVKDELEMEDMDGSIKYERERK